jgi:two-component system response regulator DevR
VRGLATGGVTAPIRVFIVDDHELVRRGLTELVTAAGDLAVVGTAASVEEALPQIPAAAPQVALLDARLPDGSGIHVCRQVRSAHPELPCVLLTSFDDDGALLAAVLAGAAGFLVKQVGGTSIVDALRTVAAGHSLIDPELTGRLLERLHATSASDDRAAALDEQDQRLLQLVGGGCTNAQIAQRLDVDEAAVQGQVEELFRKLSVRRRTSPDAEPSVTARLGGRG